MIQFIFSIIFAAGLFAALVIGYRTLSKVGDSLFKNLKIGLSGHLLPLGVVVLFAMWGYFSYATFKKACANVSRPAFYSQPLKLQKGYAIEASAPPNFAVSTFNPLIPLDTYNYKYVDQNGQRRCKSEINGKISISCVGLEDESTQYVIKILPWVKMDHWWQPPIYKAEYVVQEIKSGKVLASASELIFGGGVTGSVMRMIGGDQDYKLRGCGYVSKDIGLVRPTSSTRTRGNDYYVADLEFLSRALYPAEIAE